MPATDAELVLIAATTEALRRTAAPRHFHAGERGYQGWFFASLQAVLNELGFLAGGLVVEMEYQKSPATHRTGLRPDIVVHVPRSEEDPSPFKGNLAVYELKKLASSGPATSDLLKLESLVAILNYRLGIFVNIGAEVPGMHRANRVRDSRIHAYSVRRVNGGVEIRHEWNIDTTGEARSETLGPDDDSADWPNPDSPSQSSVGTEDP